MAQPPEALYAVIRARAAWTDAAERQVILRNVHDRAVDGYVA